MIADRVGDLDRPVVARIDVADDAHAGVVREHALHLLAGERRAVGDNDLAGVDRAADADSAAVVAQALAMETDAAPAKILKESGVTPQTLNAAINEARKGRTATSARPSSPAPLPPKVLSSLPVASNL